MVRDELIPLATSARRRRLWINAPRETTSGRRADVPDRFRQRRIEITTVHVDLHEPRLRAVAAAMATNLDSVEHSWRNVYAGELEVRPPGAPTTNSHPTEKAAKRIASGLLRRSANQLA